jgi:hypothetical protein
MPRLQLNDDEMTVLLTLAGPIDQRLRPRFLQEVAQEIEAASAQTGIGSGPRPGASDGGISNKRGVLICDFGLSHHLDGRAR